MSELIKFRSFEEEYDSSVVLKAFEKIMEALEKGDYAMANSLVKFVDSAMVYLTGEDKGTHKGKDKSSYDEVLSRIYSYRAIDDNLTKLKTTSEIKRSILKNFGVESDISFVLWHELYSKWLRDLVLVLKHTRKLGRTTKDIEIIEEFED